MLRSLVGSEMCIRDSLKQVLPKVDVLFIPHHGSLSSSSIGFINRLKPHTAIISSGYRNRFGHPHHAVVRRYVRRHVQTWNTAVSGGLRLRLLEPLEQPLIPEQARMIRNGHWRVPF